jgi:hypothetical protein
MGGGRPEGQCLDSAHSHSGSFLSPSLWPGGGRGHPRNQHRPTVAGEEGIWGGGLLLRLLRVIADHVAVVTSHLGFPGPPSRGCTARSCGDGGYSWPQPCCSSAGDLTWVPARHPGGWQREPNCSARETVRPCLGHGSMDTWLERLKLLLQW